MDYTAPGPREHLVNNVAIPCRNLEEAARWYAQVLGAQPVQILEDCVTFSVGGVLQLVRHPERSAIAAKRRVYARHHLLSLEMEDFSRTKDRIEKLGIRFLVRPAVRFAGSVHEHQTFMVVDPSGNVVELKCYVRPDRSS